MRSCSIDSVFCHLSAVNFDPLAFLQERPLLIRVTLNAKRGKSIVIAPGFVIECDPDGRAPFSCDCALIRCAILAGLAPDCAHSPIESSPMTHHRFLHRSLTQRHFDETRGKGASGCPACGTRHPIAPIGSRNLAPDRIQHDWHCDACGHGWTTTLTIMMETRRGLLPWSRHGAKSSDNPEASLPAFVIAGALAPRHANDVGGFPGISRRDTVRRSGHVSLAASATIIPFRR